MVQIRRTHEINPSFHLRSSQTIRPSKWESQRLWTIISPNVFHMKMTFKAGWVWLTGPIKSQNLSLVSFRAHLIAVSVDDRWGKAGSWWSWIITVNQKLYKSSDKLLRLNNIQNPGANVRKTSGLYSQMLLHQTSHESTLVIAELKKLLKSSASWSYSTQL